MPSSTLFVYGTLRRRSKIQIARFFHANSVFLGAARMQGRLARSHPHRGVIPSKNPSHWIAGELFRLNEPAKLWPILDDYEGPQYKRALVAVQLDSGKKLRAWMYLLKIA